MFPRAGDFLRLCFSEKGKVKPAACVGRNYVWLCIACGDSSGRGCCLSNGKVNVSHSGCSAWHADRFPSPASRCCASPLLVSAAALNPSRVPSVSGGMLVGAKEMMNTTHSLCILWELPIHSTCLQVAPSWHGVGGRGCISRTAHAGPWILWCWRRSLGLKVGLLPSWRRGWVWAGWVLEDHWGLLGLGFWPEGPHLPSFFASCPILPSFLPSLPSSTTLHL